SATSLLPVLTCSLQARRFSTSPTTNRLLMKCAANSQRLVMNKMQDIRGVAFDLDGTLVDSAPGLTHAVDMALYALELPQAGEERVITWIGNGADVLMQRAL